MLITATSTTLPMMILGTALTGLFSVVAQILVPLAATLAHPEKRGKTVGIIMRRPAARHPAGAHRRGRAGVVRRLAHHLLGRQRADDPDGADPVARAAAL